MTNARPYGSSMIPNIVYMSQQSPSTPEEAARMQRVPYRRAIGSLMYLAVGTRPDITFAVSILSRFLDNPGDAHWEAVKRLFRYLNGTKDLQLTYGGERHNLQSYMDADGKAQEDRRAISGMAILIDGGADILTKALPKWKGAALSTALGGVRPH